jgi:hypothetical protein
MRICFLSGLKEVVGRAELDLAYEGSLSELLEDLCARYGQELRCLIMDPHEPGALNPFVKILIDGEDIRHGDPVLSGNETVFVFLPIAGG